MAYSGFLAGLCVVFPNAALSQAVFPISNYRIVGNTLLNPQRLEDATRPYRGASSDFETIQKALEALEKAYIAEGFGSVKVEIPEQELESGIVTLQVVEGVLGQVLVEPNAFFDAANVKHALPALRPGQAVNIFELNRNLVLANEGGSKVTNVTFKRSENNKDVDVVVKLAAEDPERWLSTFDNTGSDSTGLYRAGLVYQNANVLNKDHALSMQLMSSPTHWSQVAIVGLGYKIPFYGWGGTLDLSASHSNVNSGQVAQAGGGPNLAISGSGDVFGIRYTHNLDSSADWQHKVNVGLDSRSYGNSVTAAGSASSLVPNLATRPLSLGYVGNFRAPARESSLNVTWLINLPGGANGTEADFNQSGGRTGAKGAFQTLKFGLQHTERFASQWTLRAALSGQFTNDLLIAAEQYGVGGADSVRGFGEREVASDYGARMGFEIWAPTFAWTDWKIVPLAFVDAAAVKRNKPLAGEIAEQNISSAGLGLRLAAGRQLSGRLDWGYVLQGVSAPAGTTANGTKTGGNKLHGTAVWVF
jgi:hemolysin activation/secretion protein